MPNSVRCQVERVIGAWQAVKDEVLGDMCACILAAGASAELLTGEYGLTIAPAGFDLSYVDPDTNEAVTKVAHPTDGSSPIVEQHENPGMIGYHGHVALVLTDGEHDYMVDPDLEVYAMMSSGHAMTKIDQPGGGPSVRFIWTLVNVKAFTETDAWKSRLVVAQRMVEWIEAAGQADTAT